MIGEELIILPDDPIKPIIKDLGVVENIVPKKPSGYKLIETLESLPQVDTNYQQEVINIGSDDLWQRKIGTAHVRITLGAWWNVVRSIYFTL